MTSVENLEHIKTIILKDMIKDKNSSAAKEPLSGLNGLSHKEIEIMYNAYITNAMNFLLKIRNEDHCTEIESINGQLALRVIEELELRELIMSSLVYDDSLDSHINEHSIDEEYINKPFIAYYNDILGLEIVNKIYESQYEYFKKGIVSITKINEYNKRFYNTFIEN